MKWLALIVSSVFAAWSAAAVTMSLDDAYRVVQPSEALISPDGQWLLFRTERLSPKDNTRTRAYWLRSCAADVAPREILQKGDSSPMWAPDSRSIFFVRGGQLFEQRLDAPSAIQHSHIEGETPWQWQLSTDRKTLLAIRSGAHVEAPGAAADVTFVEEGSNSQTRLAWDNVYRYDLATETLQQVTMRNWSIEAADLAPDGRHAVVAARPDNGRNTRWKSELYLVDLSSGEVRQLTHNVAPEATPRWSPDGTSIVFNAVRLERWELGNGDLWQLDVSTGATRDITPHHTGRFAGAPFFSPDARFIYTASGYGTARFPVRVNIESGEIMPLIQTAGTAFLGSMSRDATKYAYVLHDAVTPPEIYVGDIAVSDEKQKRMTNLNGDLARAFAFGKASVVKWKSSDGLAIEGLLILPPQEVAAPTRLPLIVHVACGPGCGWTNSFAAKNQVYAGLGYAQLFPNVRGSSNYDDAFMRANKFDIELGDRRDLLAGVDMLIERGVADASKLAISGWSYGAILGGFTITQTTRFKAATLGAMVSDWIADYGSVVYYTNERWFIGGNPWSDPERWHSRSSINYVNRVRTPVLLHHGENDTACAPIQSMNYFVGVRRFGTPARLIIYPGEGHDLQQPAHLRLRDEQDIAWLQWYVRGIREPGIVDGPWSLEPVVDTPPAGARRWVPQPTR